MTLELQCMLAGVAMIAVLFGTGFLLVPRALIDGPRLLRIAFMLASGAAFWASLGMMLACQRITYVALVLSAQAGAALYFRVFRSPSGPKTELWDWRTWGVNALVLGLFGFLFQTTESLSSDDGSIRALNTHVDLGYYAQLVQSLPEAKAANGWAAVLGSDAVMASGIVDQWYHWGALYLAILVRWCTGLSAVNALSHVVCPVLSLVQMIAAGAAAGAICRRLSSSTQLVIGCLSIMCVQWLCTRETMDLIKEIAGTRHISHMRFPLAVAFSYKYLAALAMTSIAAWLHGRWLAAGLMLFFAAVEAPHIVAAIGTASGTAMIIGMVLRRPALWKPTMAIVALLLFTWAMVPLFGGAFPKSPSQPLLSLPLAELLIIIQHFCTDLGLTFVLSLVTLPGLLHLIRTRDHDVSPEVRVLAWMALLGGGAACVVLQLMRSNPDSFHAMTLTQSLLVLPTSFWGLVRLIQTDQRQRRPLWIMLASVSVVMGIPTILGPVMIDEAEPWKTKDISIIRAQLAGRPFGYVAQEDRRWWLPKHAFLGALLEARCIRLNPLSDRTQLGQFYGERAPFHLLPRSEGESDDDWSRRFMVRLGIRDLIEAPNDPLPQAWKDQCQVLVSSGGLTLYSLPDDNH